MNPLDIGVIAVIGLSAVFAFARGFVREALSIVAWVCAGYITFKAFGYVYDKTEPLVHNPLLQQLAAGPGVFLVALVALTIVTGLIARRVRSSALSPIDRTLGFIFGLLRGAFIVCFAFLALDMMVPQTTDRPGWMRDAKSVPFLSEGADMLRKVVPDTMSKKSASAIDDAQRLIDQATDAQRAMRALSNPTAPPQSPPESAPKPTYRQSDQRQLDRLINNQR